MPTAAAINEPAAIVIWRPTPRLAADPSPAIVRLIDPVAIAVRRPVRPLLRVPDAAYVRHFAPCAVSIEILGAGVIAIGVMPPRRRLLNLAVAIFVERIPIILAGRSGDFVLRVLGVALNRDQVALLMRVLP